MNEACISLHGHFSEGHLNGFKPVEGKSQPCKVSRNPELPE